MSDLKPPKPSEEAIALWRKRKAGVVGNVTNEQVAGLARDFEKLINPNQLEGTIVRPAAVGKTCIVKLAKKWRGLKQVPAVAIEGCTKHQRVVVLRGEDKKWYALGKPNEAGVRDRSSSRGRRQGTTTGASPIAYCYMTTIRRRNSPTAAWVDFTQIWVGGFQEENILIKELQNATIANVFAAVDFRDRYYVGIRWVEGIVFKIEYWAGNPGGEPEKIYEISNVDNFARTNNPAITIVATGTILGQYLGFGSWVTAQPYLADAVGRLPYPTASVTWDTQREVIEFKSYLVPPVINTNQGGVQGAIYTTITPGLYEFEEVENQYNILNLATRQQINHTTQLAKVDELGELLLQGEQNFDGLGTENVKTRFLMSLRGYSEFEVMADDRETSTFSAAFLDGNTPFKQFDINQKQLNSSSLQPAPSFKQQYAAFVDGVQPVFALDWNIFYRDGIALFWSDADDRRYCNFFTDIYSDRVTFLDRESLLNRGVANNTKTGSTTVQIAGEDTAVRNSLFDIYPELEELRGQPLPDPESDRYQNLEHEARSCTIHVYDLDLQNKIEELLVENVFPIQYGMNREDAGDLLQPINYFFCNASYYAES